MNNLNDKQMHYEEIKPKASSGVGILLLNILLMCASIVGIVIGTILSGPEGSIPLGVTLIVISSIYLCIVGPILFAGLKVLKPNEALVLTLFGKYYGTLKGEG